MKKLLIYLFLLAALILAIFYFGCKSNDNPEGAVVKGNDYFPVSKGGQLFADISSSKTVYDSLNNVIQQIEYTDEGRETAYFGGDTIIGYFYVKPVYLNSGGEEPISTTEFLEVNNGEIDVVDLVNKRNVKLFPAEYKVNDEWDVTFKTTDQFPVHFKVAALLNNYTTVGGNNYSNIVNILITCYHYGSENEGAGVGYKNIASTVDSVSFNLFLAKGIGPVEIKGDLIEVNKYEQFDNNNNHVFYYNYDKQVTNMVYKISRQ
jgi:hypothetical protein